MYNRTLRYVETHITHHCNLNCKYCTHYAPLAEPYFKDINEYVKEIAKLAEIGSSSIEIIRILGGEPLLHPDVLQFCFITRQAFPCAVIELVTNGILLSKQPPTFFDTLNEYNISVYISDYGLLKNLDQYNLNHLRIGNKADKMLKFSINLHGVDTKELCYDLCRQVYNYDCVNLRDGYLYHCPTVAYFDIFLKYFNITMHDFDLHQNGINIFTSSLADIEQFLNQPVEFCQYCDMAARLEGEYPCEVSKRRASEWLS